MSVSIRRVAPADVESVAALFDGYRQFYSQATDVERARAFLTARLEREEAVVFLAELDGKAAGFCLLYPMFSSVHTARVWILNDLFVEPSFRKRGVARALVNQCEAFGMESGAHALQLETQRTNTVAQALYLELGWEADEEFCTYHYKLQARE